MSNSVQSRGFVHLHTHSEYSLLDGASRVKDLVARAKELGMRAIALTDHGVMYGTIDFYLKAREAGIKPIIGCEVYVAPGSRFDRTYRKDVPPYHLVLLAKNDTGYRNLMHLVSEAFLDGFYYKPRCDRELLGKYSEGLICLSGCLKGEIPRLILAGKPAEAERVACELRDLYGAENFYLEIQNQNLQEEKAINEGLAALNGKTGIPLVASNDVHYTRKEDEKAHDVLLCIQTQSTLEQEDRLQFQTKEFYLKSAAEMAAALPDFPEALENTLAIAEACNLTIELNQLLLPKYEAPEGFDLETYLEHLCAQGLRTRYGDEPSEDVMERLKFELEVVRRTGFAGYFLVVWDFVKFAKESGIMVGPGRGSAAGSIVSYVLGITSIDPLKHGLLFERFLNPERVTMPDIDIDFCSERRNEVIEYVARKYGADRVAQIITFSTMLARAAIRDAGRVLGLSYGAVDRIAKMVPMAPGEARSMRLGEALESVPELRDGYETEAEIKQVLDIAHSFEGLVRQDSIHAAGVVIARDDIRDYTPIQRKGEGEIVTQYNMGDIQRIGLLKMDFLGLGTLTQIRHALAIIKRTRGIEIDIDNIPMDDAATFKMLREGESVGLFQLESPGMQRLLKDLQPTAFADIVACLALYRPGPLKAGVHQLFADYKHGRKAVTYPHRSLEPILKETYGTIVYQEQAMQVAMEMAGFSATDADVLRKAMSKKEPAVIAEQREKFVGGALARGFDAPVANNVFNLIEHFAGYGFNKSHSAGYGVISYQTAYLKANYTVEFMAAVLTSVMGDKDKLPLYVNECRRLKIEVLPPDVNESFRDFTVVGEKIRFGLSAVRNVGDGPIASIIEARQAGGPFTSLRDFCARVDLGVTNKRAIESMIKGGAFDFTGSTRKYLVDVFESAVEEGQRSQRDRQIGQFTIFDLGDAGEPPAATAQGAASAADTVAPGSDGDRAPDFMEEFSKSELLSHEKEMLGLYVTDHPLFELQHVLKHKTDFPLNELPEKKDGLVVWVGGIITSVNQKQTRRGETMAILVLEDLVGSAEVVVFPSLFSRFRELLTCDSTVRVRGRLDLKDEGGGRGGQAKVIAQDVQSLASQGGASSGSVYVTVEAKKFNRRLLDEMKGILRGQPGGSPVYLQVLEDGKTTTFLLGTECRVDPNPGLFAELKVLLGESAVAAG